MKKLILSLFMTAGTMVFAQNTVDISTNSKTNQKITPTPKANYDVNRLIGDKQPDVFLDIPNLSVEKITLDVKKLDAHVSLDAKVANLVTIKAGVDAYIEDVKIDIQGVKAEALLVVRLDNVKEIINNALETINKNPKILEQLVNTVDKTVGTVGQVANTALKPDGLLSQTVNTLGQTVNKTLDASGNLVENVLDKTGKVVSTKTVGKLSDLQVLSTDKTDNGNTKTTYKDGNTTIDVVTDKAGKILSRVVRN